MTVPPGLRVLDLVVRGAELLASRSAPPQPAGATRETVVVVTARDAPAAGVAGVELARPDGGALPAWLPGAHVDLLLPSGRQRPYSLCGDPGRTDRYRVAVRLIADGGGGSAEVHRLQVGDVLRLRGPRHAFPLVPSDAYLFLAGGIGITPLRPMILDAEARGADWRLVLTGRSRASMPFADELLAIGGDRVTLRPDDVFGVPDGRALLSAAPAGAAVYCCGPPPLVAAVRAAARSALLGDDPSLPPVAGLHSERFSAPPVIDGRPFGIRLARSGRQLTVNGESSALDVLRGALPNLAYSCRQGFCGTCTVRVVSGSVEHHDRCLTDAERAGSMTPCVSRGQGELVLDL